MPTDMLKTLPKGWNIVKLREITETITKGTTPTTYGHDFQEEGVKFIKVENISESGEFLYKNIQYISDETNNFLKRSILTEGDILFPIAGALGRCAIVGNDMLPANINQALALLRLKNGISINPYYLTYFLRSLSQIGYFLKLKAGVAQLNLNLGQLGDFKIPLPPLPTQHKIAEILEETDNLRKLRQHADEKMKDLIPSLFVQMFGDPVKNPKRWEIKKLGEVTGIVSGSTPRTNVPEYWNGDILWITPADLSNLATIEINDSERKITKEGYASCSTTILPIGTVLLSSRAPIGHLAIAGKAMCTNQGFKSLIPQTSVNSYYLYFALRYFKERLISLGSGATFKEISKSSVEKFEIPIPHLPLQQEFATLVEDIEAEKARQAESRKKLDELFNSLMQRAFSGELVA
jgi:type I restriction enzyme S subunit